MSEVSKKEKSKVPVEPYPLPEGLTWVEIDVFDDDEMKRVYTFLEQNYVEDDDSTLRFAYSSEFLRWALTPPGWRKELNIGVKETNGKDFVCLITGVPCTIFSESEKKMVEINFLCVHKKLRGRRLAPLLIKEISRRVLLRGVTHAFYTSGDDLVKNKISKTRYHLRSLNPRKLVSIGFSPSPSSIFAESSESAMNELVESLSLPKTVSIKGWRRLEKKDCPQALSLFSKYMKENFKFYHIFDLAEFEHWMLNRKDIISSFVVEDEETKKITDFIGYFHLPSSIINHEKYKVLRAAYLFYYTPSSKKMTKKDVKKEDQDEEDEGEVGDEDEGLKELLARSRISVLVESALIEARNEGIDVFQALNIGRNKEAFYDNVFSRGSGNLHYYLGRLPGKRIPNYLPQEIAIPML